MDKKNQCKKGFTIVEVSLALIFVAIILITIAWLTIHITSVYEKGLAMKAVNSTGKEIIDDFSRAISTSPARTVESLCGSKYNPETRPTAYNNCVSDNARKFSYIQHYGNVVIKGQVKQVPTNGAFCTGRYSYVWNTAYVLNDTSKTGGIYNKEEYQPLQDYKATVNFSDNKNNFRLLKVSDYNRELCTQHLLDDFYYYDFDNSIAKTNQYILTGTPDMSIDLLSNSQNNLALYDMTIFKPTVHKVTSAAFYSGTFILATLRGGININATGEFCSDPPDNLDTDFAYCAINKFNFAMRAAGEKSTTER